MFILDGSGSIGTTNFEKVRQFTSNVVDSFTVGPDAVRVGVIKFSDKPKVEFNLTKYETKADVQNKISKMEYLGGYTYSDKALRVLAKEMTLRARWAEGIPTIGLFMTDGQSTEPQKTIGAAKKIMKNDNFTLTMYAIGITNNVDEAELNHIGSDPDCLHVHIVDSFDHMEHFVQQIEQLACKSK